jgi:hypothetical protein
MKGSTTNDSSSLNPVAGTIGDCTAVLTATGIGPSPTRNASPSALLGPPTVRVCANPTPSVGIVMVCTVVFRSYSSEYPPRMTVLPSSPNRCFVQPLVNEGVHAAETRGEKFVQSISKAWSRPDSLIGT